MSPFEFDDYRLYLDKRIRSEWGAITRVAEAAHCQRSYLSRAIKGEVLLTPDHLYGICEYWRQTDEETDYLMLLLEKARASTSRHREHIERKLNRLLRKQENLADRLRTPRIAVGDREVLYYSAWYWVAIHLSTAIPALQTEKSISQHLHLPPPLVKSVIEQLFDWGLVQRAGERWVFNSGNLHLPKNSPLIGQHHSHLRSKAVEDSLNPLSDGLHYSQMQAMEESTYQKFKQLFLQSIDDSLRLADPAKEERLVAVTLDVFKVF